VPSLRSLAWGITLPGLFLVGAANGGAARAAETVIWYEPDVPPAFVLSGPDKGTGFAQKNRQLYTSQHRISCEPYSPNQDRCCGNFSSVRRRPRLPRCGLFVRFLLRIHKLAKHFVKGAIFANLGSSLLERLCWFPRHNGRPGSRTNGLVISSGYLPATNPLSGISARRGRVPPSTSFSSKVKNFSQPQ